MDFCFHLGNIQFSSWDFPFRKSHLQGATRNKVMAEWGLEVASLSCVLFFLGKPSVFWQGLWFVFSSCMSVFWSNMESTPLISSDSPSSPTSHQGKTKADWSTYSYKPMTKKKEWVCNNLDWLTHIIENEGGWSLNGILHLKLFCHRDRKTGNSFHSMWASHSGLPENQLWVSCLSRTEPICLEASVWKWNF